MGIISVEHTYRLYWLGRYSERVYTTAGLYAKSFDDMLDHHVDGYADFCRRLDIPNIYTSKEDFCRRYCFDETDGNSIYSNLLRAYDNAVVLREEIGSEPLAYIQLAVYEMNKAKLSEAPLIELQRVTDNILAFWGITDDLIESENVRNIIKIGKRVERIDLLARLHMSGEDLRREACRLTGRIDRTCLSYHKENLEEINRLVEAEEIDYYRLVTAVETLLED